MNGNGGPVSAPSLTRSVRRRPSLPTAYSGSTPPNGIGAIALGSGAAGAAASPERGSAVAGVDGGRRWLNTAAPLPGSPTALVIEPPRPPPPPPPNVEGARIVRRLGAAIRPPGHSHELGGWPPVAAA